MILRIKHDATIRQWRGHVDCDALAYQLAAPLRTSRGRKGLLTPPFLRESPTKGSSVNKV